MTTTFSEPITVAVRFEKGNVVPLSFRYRQRFFSVESISFHWITRTGTTRFLHFSVVVSRTLYELVFNTSTFVWTLREVYSE